MAQKEGLDLRHQRRQSISRCLWVLGLAAFALAMLAAALHTGATAQVHISDPPKATIPKPDAAAPAQQNSKGEPKPAHDDRGKSQMVAATAQPKVITLGTLDAIEPQFCAGDGDKSDAWVQIERCAPRGNRVLAWPLFSIDAKQMAASVPVAKCLSPDRTSCQLDDPKKSWLVGPAQTGDNIQPHVMTIEVGQGMSGSQAYKSLGDEQAAILLILEDRLRLLELAWRLGQSSIANDSIFTLKEGTAENSHSRNIGTCMTVTVAQVSISDQRPWVLQSDCNLPGSPTSDQTLSQNSLLGTIAFGLDHPFKWSMQDPDEKSELSEIKIRSGEVIHLRLFPFTNVPFDAANGPDVQLVRSHQNVPIPAGLIPAAYSSSYLLTMDIPLNATATETAESDEVKGPTDRQPQWIRKGMWLAGATLALITGWVVFWKREQIRAFFNNEKGRKAPSTRRQPASTSEGILAGSRPNDAHSISRPLEVVEPAEQTVERASEVEDDIVNRATRRVEAKLEKLINDAIELKNNRRSTELDERQEQIIARVTQVAEPFVATRVREEVESKFKELGGATFPQLRAQIDTTIATLDQRIKDKLKESATLWAQSLTSDLPEWPAATIEPRGKIRPPFINDQARKILGAMRDLSQLAFELLALWSRVRRDTASDWEQAGLGRQILSDLRALESIVFVDWPLWTWLCGGLEPSALTEGLVRFGMNRWRVPEATELDAAAVAREWAQVAIPVLQNLVEGAPNYFHLNDPSGFRRAIVELSERHPGIASAPILFDPNLLPVDLHLIAASETLHCHISALYNSIGVQYFRMRLFRDTITSRDIPLVIDQSRQAYPFQLGRDLVSNGIENRHGLIVRIGKPHIKSANSGWAGSLYYLEESRHA